MDAAQRCVDQRGVHPDEPIPDLVAEHVPVDCDAFRYGELELMCVWEQHLLQSGPGVAPGSP